MWTSIDHFCQQNLHDETLHSVRAFESSKTKFFCWKTNFQALVQVFWNLILSNLPSILHPQRSSLISLSAVLCLEIFQWHYNSVISIEPKLLKFRSLNVSVNALRVFWLRIIWNGNRLLPRYENICRGKSVRTSCSCFHFSFYSFFSVHSLRRNLFPTQKCILHILNWLSGPSGDAKKR